MAEHLRYCLGYRLRAAKKSLGIGSAVHKGIETRDIGAALAMFDEIFPSSQGEADALEVDRATVVAMLGGYLAIYPAWEIHRAEQQFEIPIINPATGATSRSFRLAGKIDDLALIGCEWWLVEYKTSSQINAGYFDRLLLDDQITTYIYAAQKQFGIKIAGVIYRVLKKPSIRQTQKETLPQFCRRLEQDYLDRPDFYYYEQKLYRSQDDLARFEAELWQFAQHLLHERRLGIAYRNPSRCLDWGRCEYMPICTNEPEWELRYEIRAAHEELEEEKNESIT